MARKITVTVPVDVRTPKPREVKIKVWLGTKWKYIDWTPFSPALAGRNGTEPHSYQAVLEFLPPGTPSIDALRYKDGLLKSMRQIGVIR